MTAPAPPHAPLPEVWPTEPAKATEPAGARSQVAVYVVGAVAIGIACGAADVLEWGVAAMLALAAGVAIGLLADLGRHFRSVPGAVASLITMAVLTIVVAFIGGSPLLFGCVPLAGALILGLDWDLVRRLRPLPFAFGFLVVIGAGGDTWTYPAGLLWLVLALGALASLEADRRAGQPQVVAVTGGPAGDDLRKGDVATSVLVALALALVAALLLSTPSCQRSDQGSGRSGSGQSGSGEAGSGEFGSGENGTGTAPGSSGSEHLYVPNPDGQFLVPNDGEPRSGAGGDAIPSPTLLPEAGEAPRVLRYEDGSVVTAERLGDGTGRATVEEPDGTTRTYTYRERSDGLIVIQERDEDGNVGRTLFYDPQGRIATDEEATAGSGDDPTDQQTDQDQDQQDDDENGSFKLDGRLLALIAVALAALGALVWWLSRRTPKAPPPDAPPWAVRLARDVDREGAARGPARRRSQSLVRYADDLQAGPLPDPRLADVADVVSTALFARTDPGPEAQRWAETTWADIVAAHPQPSRADRRRAKAGSSST
ncbi:MAG: hypothetical protein JWO77_3777 [Ilumatobacteraceae bacterium]|nr:hypothetical protein [Ilumatobacteraceae bacterium]